MFARDYDALFCIKCPENNELLHKEQNVGCKMIFKTQLHMTPVKIGYTVLFKITQNQRKANQEKERGDKRSHAEVCNQRCNFKDPTQSL